MTRPNNDVTGPISRIDEGIGVVVVGAEEEGVNGGPGKAEGAEGRDQTDVRSMCPDIPLLNCKLTIQLDLLVYESETFSWV